MFKSLINMTFKGIKMKILILFLFFISLCASFSSLTSLKQADKNVHIIFTYDYEITETSSEVLWIRAIDYFAKVYDDSKFAPKVQEKESATLIGKRTASWKMMLYSCISQYSFQLIAKGGKLDCSLNYFTFQRLSASVRVGIRNLNQVILKFFITSRIYQKA
jgi:hypothetical protein